MNYFFRFNPLFRILASVAGLWFAVSSAVFAANADISEFVGSYAGSAELVSASGETRKRDMSVDISETRRGFVVQWTTVTYRADGSEKEKSYEIEFRPSDRDSVFSAAMTTNVFGHEVQMDPMKGEPYVWARIEGETLTVFSLFVDAAGEYELQQFDRTLAEGGITVEFESVRDGAQTRRVSTFLQRQ